MLNNISWQGYGTFLALTVSFYYSVILFLFYRKALIYQFQKRFRSVPDSPPVTEAPDQTSIVKPSTHTQPPADEPEYLPAVRSLIDEIQAYFESLENTSVSRQSLLSALQSITQEYPGVRSTAYRHAVTNLIAFLAEQNSALQLSAAELDGVWL